MNNRGFYSHVEFSSTIEAFTTPLAAYLLYFRKNATSPTASERI
jgi:hypothetical protein